MVALKEPKSGAAGVPTYRRRGGGAVNV